MAKKKGGDTTDTGGEIKVVDVVDIVAERQRRNPGKIDGVELAKQIATINEEFCVIQRGSQVLIMRHWINEKGESRLAFFKRPDFLLLMENKRIWFDNEDGEKVSKPLAQLWLSSKDRKQYDEVYFEPNGVESETMYNLWQGFAVRPDAKAGKFDIFLDHIKTNICQEDEGLYVWVVSWLADMFQRPERKPGTALVLRGEMGIGKGAFANHVGKLLGVHYMTISQGNQLTGKFNGHIADKLLIFADESFWDDDKKGAGVIRAAITEPYVSVELKGKDAIMIKNFSRYIMAANDDWVVPVGMKDERRIAAIDVGKLVQGDKAYFQEMEKQLQNGGYQALLHYLLNYEYDPELPGRIPKTKALLEQKLFSMPHYLKWWQGCLINGFITRPTTNIENWPIEGKIPVDDFYKSYTDWCKVMQITKMESEQWLPRRLIKFVKIRKERVKGDNTYYWVGNLDQCRGDFNEAIGHEIDWKMEDVVVEKLSD